MRSLLRKFGAALLGLLAASLLLWPAGCKSRTASPGPKPAPDTPAAATTIVSWKNYQFEFTEKGQPAWQAEIASGQTDVQAGVLTLHGVRSDCYRHGQKALHVTADGGKAVQGDDRITVSLNGHVVAVDAQQRVRLTAESFHWVSGTDTVTATKVHWSSRDGLQQWADRGTFSLSLQQAKLRGHVRSEYTPAGSE